MRTALRSYRPRSIRVLPVIVAALAGSTAIVACATEGTESPPTFGPVVEAGASDGGTRDAATTDGRAGDGGATNLDASATTDATSADAGADARVDSGTPDASRDASVDTGSASGSTTVDAGCPDGVIAIVGGTVTTAFGAFWTNGNAAPATTIGTSTASTPAILASGSTFYTLFRTSGSNALRATEGTAGTWGTLANVGTSLVLDAPAMALVGTQPNVVYRGTDSKMYGGVYSGGAWNGAADPVGGSGTAQSFGPSAPVAMGGATELLVAQSGDNGHVYAQKRTTTWETATQISTEVADKAISPALSPLRGGPRDAMLVWVNQQGHTLKYATRSAGTWTTPASVYDLPSNLAFSNYPVVVSALPAGRAVLAYRGTDDNLYFSVFDGATSPTWSAPARVTSAANMTPTVPSLAEGTCGSDAVLGFVDGTAGGLVKLTRFTGNGTWTPPEVVPQTNGTTFVAIATR
ncbi:MAG: hypothetical protein U0169_02860 [Polyangiaceae bacterium]